MSTQSENGKVLNARLALEALRNGVPNREAVKILGCNQPKAERLFEQMLSKAEDSENPPSDAQGMLVSGDFGTGKSHLLTHLENLALSRGFVCSTVAISKETPLYDLAKVFKSAMDNARMPYRSGRLIEELGQALKPNSQEYANFFMWADNTKSNNLHPIFPPACWSTNAPTILSGTVRLRTSGQEIKSMSQGSKQGCARLGCSRTIPSALPR